MGQHDMAMPVRPLDIRRWTLDIKRLAIGKKGIEMQFFWIFVLIAGGLILAFFLSLALQQKAAGEQKIMLDLSRDVEAVFTSALQTPGTVQNITMPSTGVGLTCTQACDCNFLIGQTNRGFKDKIIFGPKQLKDFDMLFWTYEWKVPYRVEGLLLVTNPNIHYIFVYDNTPESTKLEQELLDKLPSDMIKDFTTDMPTLSPAPYPHTRIVYLRTDVQTSLSHFQNIDTDALYIDDSHGTLTYYTKPPNIATFITSGTGNIRKDDFGATLAAIYADDANMYKCGMTKAYKKLNTITQLIITRTQTISSGATGACATQYSAVQTLLNTILSWSYDSPGDQMTLTDLDNANNEIIRQSCPQVY